MGATPLPDWVWESLRCPRCSGALTAADGALRCGACDRTYPLVEGVPVLLDDGGTGTAVGVATAAGARPARVLEAVDHVLPALGRNLRSAPNYRRLALLLRERTDRRPRILVVGGGVLGKGVEALLDGTFDVVETDIALRPRTALACDVQALPFMDGCFDAAVAQAVLPAVPDPERAVAELHRVLTENGLVYAESAFMQQVWAGSHDFTRWTFVGHRSLFRAFDQLDGGILDGPGTVAAWTWQYLLLSLSTSRWPRLGLRAIARLTGAWLKYLDRMFEDSPAAYDGASSFFFLGRRREQPLTDDEVVAAYRGGFRS